jgi:hypothetical protein
VDDAIAAPRWVFGGSMLLAEAGLPPLAPLPGGMAEAAMPAPELAGHAHAILLGDGLVAACDPRADGVAVGD